MTDATPASSRPKVLLIGWDGADWILLNQLIEAGRMPNLSRFIDEGVIGNLASLMPCLTPMLWTSIATGKTADQHGILGFVEPTPDGNAVIPCRSSTRLTPALWNMLDQSGLKSGVIAWPVSDPVEPISGVYVSERMIDNLAGHPGSIAPAPPGCVHPAKLEPWVSELRLHPCEFTPADLSLMIPDWSRIDLSQDKRPEQVARLLARCASVHAVATAAMAAEPWDAFAVYYETLDRAGHDFMSYRAPRMDHIAPTDFDLYNQVIDGLYEFHDAMLGRLIELAGVDTTIILASDHGFQSGNGRPATQGTSGAVPADGADWHRMLGVLAIKGPGIKRDERIYGASLLDIAPTILTLLGLPVGRDMPGNVLTEAFEQPPQIRYIETWDNIAATPPSPPLPPLDLEARQASVRQLVALGYVCEEAIVGPQAALQATREANFNLAIVHLHHGRPAIALPLLESLCRQNVDELRYQDARLLTLSRLARHQDVLDEVRHLESLGKSSAQWHLLAATAHASSGQGSQAIGRFHRAATLAPHNPTIHQVIGDYFLEISNFDQAAACYARAMAIAPDNAPAHCGMAQIHLNLGNLEQAAQSALTSLQQAYWNPKAQFLLGKAQARLGRNLEARHAFEQTLHQFPGFSQAHHHLAALYESEGDYLKAATHRQLATSPE